MKKGKFYGIGVGPGDPDLLTIKALSAIKESDYIFEVLSGEDKDSISGKIAKQHCRRSTQFVSLLFPMKNDNRLLHKAWKNNAEKIVEKVKSGYVCSFVTIGDPMLYSTCAYIVKELKKLINPSLIEIIPGISSFQYLAAKAQIPIAEGEENASIFPAFSEDALTELTKEESDSIIVMKPYKNKNKISDIAKKMNYDAVYGSNLSMDNEDICKKNTDIKKKKSNYLSIFILKKQKENKNMKDSEKYQEIKKVKAFTLVELLVVMAVILLLAGLFLPALNRARKQAVTTSCMNNLSQISKASALYLSDSEYYMPCFAADVTMANNGKTWLGYRTISGSGIIYNLKTGFIADYIKENTQVLYCPAWKKASNDTELNATYGTGYGYNNCIGTWIYLTKKSYGSGAGLKVNQVANPSATVGFGDTCNATSTKPILRGIPFIYPKYTPEIPLERIVFPKLRSNGDNIHFGRHAGTANILWLDGHASQEKASRIKSHDLARKELIGNFGPDDNSLFDPWNL